MHRIVLTLFFAASFFLRASSQDLKGIQGSWIAEIDHLSVFDGYGEASMTMKWESDGDHYRYTFSLPLEDFEDLPRNNGESNRESAFHLDREAGRLQFTGSMDDDVGSGQFTFTANPEFLAEMSALGYENISPDEQIKMAIYNVTPAFVRQVRQVSNVPES